jgi:hypothetical protein
MVINEFCRQRFLNFPSSDNNYLEKSDTIEFADMANKMEETLL